jgi:spore germination protein KC
MKRSNSRKSKRITMVLLLLGIISLSGCWNWREINQLAIIAGTGIDLDKTSQKILVTVQIIKPGDVKSADSGDSGGKTGGSGKIKPVWTLKSTGGTITEAIRNFVFQSDRKLYFSHNEIVIFGKDAAYQGVRPFFDFFVRSVDPRPTMGILVADGKAGDVLQVPGHLEKISAFEIDKLLDAQNMISETVSADLQDFTSRLLSKTTAPIASRIQIINIDGEPQVRVLGTAVFKEDKLIGELDKKETRGLLWVLGKVRHGIILVNAPGGDGKVSLEIADAGSKIKAQFKNGKWRINLGVKEEGMMVNETGTMDLSKTDLLKSLARREATVIRREISAALEKAQQLNADIYGFGEVIHRTNPKEWRKIGPEWDKLYPKLDVIIDIRVKIKGTGLITKPIVPEQSQ